MLFGYAAFKAPASCHRRDNARGLLAVQHALDVGTVVALVSYLARLYAPLLGLSNIQVSVMTALVSFERVFEILDLPPMIQEKPGAVAIPSGPATISFDHVSFRYPAPAEVSLASLESIAVPDKRPEKTVLTDIDFNVAAGQLVALVGPSGAGKTTITHLVPRLYDVQSGSIRIDGIDVRDAKLERAILSLADLHDACRDVGQLAAALAPSAVWQLAAVA